MRYVVWCRCFGIDETGTTSVSAWRRLDTFVDEWAAREFIRKLGDYRGSLVELPYGETPGAWAEEQSEAG
jgi:hypothetical protein